MMHKKSGFEVFLWILLVVGGLNWGLIGFFEFDLVMAIFGQWPMLVRVIYALVGLSAIYFLIFACKGECMPMGMRKEKK